MKAKRIFAGLSALTLATTMLTVSAFASEASDRLNEIKPDDSGNPDPNPASTTVTYSVDPTYTVTIPTTVTLSDTADVTDSVSASGVRLEKGKKIVVSLADSNDFKVKNGDESVTYKVSNTAGELAKGSTVKEFTAAGSETLTFAKINKDDVKYAGNYTGSLTFNIAVENAVTTRTVTFNTATDGNTINKDGVTCGDSFDIYVNLFCNHSGFSVSSGQFTKIEVTASYTSMIGQDQRTLDTIEGWSTTSETTATWTGKSSTVPFGVIMGDGDPVTIVFTIEE